MQKVEETGSSKVDKSTALLFLTDILAGKYDQDLLEPEFADKLIPIAEKYESGGDQEMLNLLEKAVEYYINKNDANAVRGE